MLSCNARGLWDKLKRKTMFNKMLSSQYDIIFFMTHTAPQILKTHGIKIGLAKLSIIIKNNARGTIITFNPQLHPIIHDIIVDDQGRSIILDCTILKHHIILVNICAPNTDGVASPFFESTFKEIC